MVMQLDVIEGSMLAGHATLYGLPITAEINLRMHEVQIR